MITTRRARERGTILIVAMTMLMVTVSVAYALSMTALNDRSSAQQRLVRVQTRALAEGASLLAQQQIQLAVASKQAPPLAGTVLVRGRTFTWTATTDGAIYTRTSSDGSIVIGQQFVVNVTALDSPNALLSRTRTVAHRAFEVGKIPAFQFAIFYDRDLEIFPGAGMTVRGRVQTNRNMRLGSSSGLTLDTSWVHAAGDFFRSKESAPGTAIGSVSVWVDGSSATPGTGTGTFKPWSGSPPWVSASEPGGIAKDPNFTSDVQAQWNGTVMDGAAGAQSVAPPDVKTTAPGGYYDQVAAANGLQIRYDATSGQPKAYQNGVDVTGALPAGTLSQSTFYDDRQGVSVTVTDIDISKLNGTAYYPLNGVIFAERGPGTPAGGAPNMGDSTPAQPNGIRLVNGSIVSPPSRPGQASGLSVVTPDPLFVKGDFNTGAPAGSPPNLANKQPCAVLTDGLNLLSNAWNDASEASPSYYGTASETHYDFSFVTGNVPSVAPGAGGGDPSGYSGGVENLPRFHESWSGVNCHILGSMCCLWQSQVAIGNWTGTGSPHYDAPTRDYAFDPDLLAGKFPPEMPYGVEITRSVFWVDP